MTMSATITSPSSIGPASFHGPSISMDRVHPISVDQYEQMIEFGVLSESDQVELLNGILVRKMSRTSPHDSRLSRIIRLLRSALPAEWMDRSQMAITLQQSVPEPDLAIVRFDPDDYAHGHPRLSDLGVVIEVADSSLESDQQFKRDIYAFEGVPEFWIVNIPQQRVEVYQLPTDGVYQSHQVYTIGSQVPLMLSGQLISTVDVAELFR